MAFFFPLRVRSIVFILLCDISGSCSVRSVAFILLCEIPFFFRQSHIRSFCFAVTNP